MNGTVDQPAGAVPSDRRSMLQNALEAIERLQSRLDAAEAARHEPIAIVGLGCRLPGGVVDARSYWELLSAGRDAVSEVPAERWNVDAYYDPDPTCVTKAHTKAGGFLDDVFGFEPGFFGMSPREAAGLDPQQRLLLEVAWEALEDAAIPADRLEGSRTGVFVGITSTDYAQRIDLADPARSDMYLATGTALNAAAGRISFTLGLQGPCMAIDTACSSSLVAIHTACQSLRAGESQLALAGGVNAILAPEPYVLISKWGMLSPDGRCKTFDASANGFVRGEGCGIIVLERLSDAIANGRRVLAVIRGSAINQDGRSSGLTVPNGLAQAALLRQALAAARLAAPDVSYVEAHGTGTSLGDPIEVEALASVYDQGRDRAQPLEIGSVKSNIGHLEAAAGVSGLIKVVLAMQQRRLPASLHVRQPTPAIPWDRMAVRVCDRLHDWAPSSGVLRAGVSAFGFSGMNAHVIVEEAPAARRDDTPAATGAHLLVLSAKGDAALAALAQRYAQQLEADPALHPSALCATAALGRSHFSHRLAVLGPDSATLAVRLRADPAAEAGVFRGRAAATVRVRVAFLFSGQGSQYLGMGRELDESEPVYRAALDRCAAALDPLLPRPLRELLYEDTAGLLDQTGCTQAALFALQVALAALWRHRGVEPSVVIGHSVGEYAAAVVAGALTLEDAARLVAARGRLMQALPAGGVMSSVQGDADVIERELAPHAAQVAVAARNAPGQLVLAGPREPVEAIVARLAAQGMRTQALTVSHAFHSPLMEPMVAEFHRIAAAVPHTAPTITWISNLGGGVFDAARWGDRMADYWSRHVREPVDFEAGVRTLADSGVSACVEIGPGGTLIGLAQQGIADAARIEWLSSLRRGRPATEHLLEGAARLYVRGARLDWQGIVAPGAVHSLRLPSYPFQRQRFLVEPRTAPRRNAATSVHELLGERMDVAGVAAQFERRIRSSDPAWLAEHRIGGLSMMPMTAYLELALVAAREAGGTTAQGIEHLEVAAPLNLRDDEERVLQVIVDEPIGDAPARLRIFSRDAGAHRSPWTLHATAAISRAEPLPLPAATAGDTLQAADPQRTYARMRELGIEFGPLFLPLRELHSGERAARGVIELPESGREQAARYLMHPALLDGCFHVAASIGAMTAADDGRVVLPVGVDSYRWFALPGPRVVSEARLRDSCGSDELLIDIRIATPDGRPVAELSGLRCRRAGRELLRQNADAQAAQWQYGLSWPAVPLPGGAALSGRWLVFDDAGGLGERLAAEIARRGAQARRVRPGTQFAFPAEGIVEIDPERPDHLSALLTQASDGGALAGVVSLWPLRVPALTADAVPSGVQRFGTEAALRLVQALAASPAPLWLVSAAAEAVDGSETPRIEQAPLAGLARVAAAEHPELQVTHVDLESPSLLTDMTLLADELGGASAERRLALRKSVRHVARLARLPRPTARPVDEAPVRLQITERGTLENLRLVPTPRRAPGPGEVELRVHASGVNFRDVLAALGLYPGELRMLGSDCAGEIVAIGEGVQGLAIGDRVIAMTEGAFATHTTTRAEFVAALPPGIGYEVGASIPTAWLTADITLNQIAGMKAGDRVLIHAGAGGVGMAAIALARRAGAEIFATAGSPDKRAALLRLGVAHVLDSRSPAFADELLRITGDRGVDIVLNSLHGAMLDRSFEVLAEGGTFLEIGKRDLWTHERVARLGRGIRYHVVDCNEHARDTPHLVGATFRRVLGEIAAGTLPLPPVTTFTLAHAADAFRHMAQARHIGRVVLRHPVVAARLDTPLRPTASYLVTGGLRGLGLLAAQWLAGEGARHLVLAARSAPDAAALAAIEALQRAGVEVTTVAADLGTAQGVERTLDALQGIGAPLGGVVHGAAVLDDGVLLRQTPARFAAVMAPKADAAWRLHCALQRRGLRPDFFVMHSSMSALMGSPGQGNYVAANAFLDALARHRRLDGEAATSIAWGAWKDVGMAARGGAAERAEAQGFSALAPAQGMQAMGLLLRDGVGEAAVAPIDWTRVAASLAGGAVPPLLRELIDEARRRAVQHSAAGPVAAAPGEATDYAGVPAGQRTARLAELVRRELARVLGLSGSAAAIADDQPFSNLGLDSLTSVELRNRLQSALGRPVSATAAFDWPSVGELAGHLDTMFAAETDAAAREEVTL